MAIHKRRPTPKVGSRFERLYKGKTRTLHIIESEGQISFKLDGKTFKSPSAAAKTLTKHEVNGWKFWNIH